MMLGVTGTIHFLWTVPKKTDTYTRGEDKPLKQDLKKYLVTLQCYGSDGYKCNPTVPKIIFKKIAIS